VFILKTRTMKSIYNTLRDHAVFGRFVKAIRKIYYFLINRRDKEFPTQPYVFSKNDAKKVYYVVLSGKLHHKSGTEVISLEREFAEYHGVSFALATNAGTSALEMAIKSIGIHPGDEVIVPAYTFVATAQAVISRGGIPIFADIDDTFTISPDSILKHINKRTKAIIPVHIFGNVADMDQITKIAKRYKLFVIEDCCQAIGASYRNKKVGALGDIGCFSFNEKKAVTTGQGGMFITANKDLFTIANLTRETGQLRETTGSDVVTTGNTYAMTEMQAVLARSILAQLDVLNLHRRRNYDCFVKLMDSQDLPIRWYRILPEVSASFSRLVFMIDFRSLGISRNSFIDSIRLQGIPMKTFYPVPLYMYSLFKKRMDCLTKNRFPFTTNTHVCYAKHLPYVELFCAQQAGIEFSPYLTDTHISNLCRTLRTTLLSYVSRSST